MNYWLVKSEPDTYSWDDLVKDKKTTWDGVRNFRARTNLKSMEKGDLAFFYHSNEGKEIVGIAQVVKGGYPDPKDKDWVVVDLSPKKKLKKPITLAAVKADKKLTDMELVRISRLSVQKVKTEEFDYVIALSEE